MFIVGIAFFLFNSFFMQFRIIRCLMNADKLFFLFCLIAAVMCSMRLVTSHLLTIQSVNWCILKYELREADRIVSLLEQPTCPKGESWLHSRLQEPEFARETLESFLLTHPNHQIAQLRLGENKWKAGKEADALAIWQEVPKMDVYFAHRSAHVAKQGEVTEAQKLADIAQLVNPEPRSDKGLMYQELCQAWQNKGEPKRALPWCEFGTQVVRNGWTHLALAQVQYKLREYEQALLTLEWVVEKGPQELKGKADQQMGEVYLATGRLQEAVHAYQAALTQGVSNKWLQMGLAQALWRSGQLEEACIYYANAHQLGYSVSPTQQRDFEVCD